jgi:hypothetical protein
MLWSALWRCNCGHNSGRDNCHLWLRLANRSRHLEVHLAHLDHHRRISNHCRRCIWHDSQKINTRPFLCSDIIARLLCPLSNVNNPRQEHKIAIHKKSPYTTHYSYVKMDAKREYEIPCTILLSIEEAESTAQMCLVWLHVDRYCSL